MKIMDLLAPRLQRSADRRDERYRQHLEAVHAGTATPTLAERYDAIAARHADADQRLSRKIGQVIQLLAAGPVSGPDGIPVLICLSEHASSRPLKLPLPKAWLQAIAAEPTLTGQVARIEMGTTARDLFTPTRCPGRRTSYAAASGIGGGGPRAIPLNT